MNKVKATLIQIYDKVIEEDKIYLVEINGKYGVVDKHGNGRIEEFIEPKYTALGDKFCEGMLVTRGEGGLGFIDDNGREIIPCQYHSITDFSNGLAGARRKGEKWGFINKQGKEVIPPTFDEVLQGFSKTGIAEVELNKEIFHINRTGKQVNITKTHIQIEGTLNSYEALFDDGAVGGPKSALLCNSSNDLTIKVNGNTIIDEVVLNHLERTKYLVNTNVYIRDGVEGIRRTKWYGGDSFSCEIESVGYFDPQKLRLNVGCFLFEIGDEEYTDNELLLKSISYEGNEIALTEDDWEIWENGMLIGYKDGFPKSNGYGHEIIWGTGEDIPWWDEE